MAKRFIDSKIPTGFVRDEGAEVGTLSLEYLMNTLNELYELRKVIERDIRIAEQKLKIKQEGRDVRYNKYPIEDVR